MAKHSISNALVLAGCLHATVKLYRCIHLQEQFAQLGIEADVLDWHDQPLAPALADDIDLLVLQRSVISANLRRLIDAMHARGKPVVFDADDLVFEPGMVEWHRGAAALPANEQTLYADGVQRTQATLETCDAVLAASPLLVELAQRHGKPAFLHRNAVGAEMQALGDRLYAQRRNLFPSGSETGRHADRSHSPTPTLVLGYGSGTPTHDVDFATITPALVDLLSRHPQVELWLMGPLVIPAVLDLFAARIRRFPLSGWQEYLKLASQLDVMLAPLEAENLFCRAKSEIKWVEAALLGIPTVAARSDPFEQAITPGVDGFLAGNTAEWIEALEALITQPVLRSALGDAARGAVAQRHSLTARTAELGETLTAMQRSLVSNPQSPVSGAPSGIQSPVSNSEPPLVLNWVITEPFRGSGGHLGIFRMIQHLVEFGHECHIYVEPVIEMHNWSADQIRTFVEQQVVRTGAHFHRWTGHTGQADATIATYWSTVQNVQQLADPGRCYYLVQDFEPSFYPMGANYVLAENTYRQGFHCITLGRWLTQLLRERYQAQADYFDFAVDADIYWPQPQRPPPNPRVAFYARPSTPRRAYELGIDALAIVKRQYPNVEIVLFGANELAMPPFAASLVGIRNPYELATLYSSCEVGLVLSLTNPSFVPLEMMACKCAVVDIRSERLEGLLADRQTALLAEPTPQSVAGAILELLWDKELRTAITERAYAQTRQLSWQASARQIEHILLDHAPPPAKRRQARRAHEEDADSLLWQIHQLLGGAQTSSQQTAQLEALLQRTIDEKAKLAEQLRQTEAALAAARRAGANPLRALRQAPAHMLAEAPTWVLGQRMMGKLPFGASAVEQQFTARASHLCKVELSFAPYRPAAAGELQMRLYDLAQPQQPVAEQTVMAAEIPLDRPFTFEFAAQPYSTDRRYRLALCAVGDGVFAHALWRYWSAPGADAHLRRDGRRLRGQLLFQLGYLAKNQPSAPSTMARNGQSPQPMTAVAYTAGQQAIRESSRLAEKTRHAFRTRGPLGLLREVINYLRWRLDTRFRS